MIAGRKSQRPRSGQDVSSAVLFGLALAPLVRWLERKRLEAQLRSLNGLATYFEWQQENAMEGLADTHRRIAITQSDLNALR